MGKEPPNVNIDKKPTGNGHSEGTQSADPRVLTIEIAVAWHRTESKAAECATHAQVSKAPVDGRWG